METDEAHRETHMVRVVHGRMHGSGRSRFCRGHVVHLTVSRCRRTSIGGRSCRRDPHRRRRP